MSPNCALSTTQRRAWPHLTDLPHDWRAQPRSRYRQHVLRHLLPLMILVAGCSSEGGATKQTEKAAETERKLAGVFPDRFQCDSIAKTEQIAQLLGAVKANKLESAMGTPKGVPQPCNYEVVMQSVMEYWTYDIDCRDQMKQRADALFAQYKKTSAELVQQYDQASDAGMVKPTDAGIVIKRPDDAVEVQVGAKA